MKILYVFLILILFVSVTYSQEIIQRSDIHITIINIRNNNGAIRIALYKTKEGFPDKPQKAYKLASGEIKDKKSEIILKDIPYGEYAIGILHDENNNGKMDNGLFGIPIEGYGASNNAKGFMRSPAFDDSKFIVGVDLLRIVINVNY